jgi:diketogulonate reductase-like aldo/keto reductase
VNQIECHPEYPQRDTLAFCRERGVAVVAYSSLGRGDLLSDPAVRAVAAAASARGPRAVTPAQVLLRWALDRGMAVIPKSGDPGRIRENLGCVADGCGLTGEEAAGLDALGARYRKRCWDPSGVL